MKIAIIGRSEILYEAVVRFAAEGYTIALIVTARAAPEYRKNISDFADLAERLGATFFATPHIQEKFDSIRALGMIDIGISFNYTGVIPQDVIDLFPLGILNAHSGDLPRYRGNACQSWAILNGEKRIGLCVHKMVGGEIDSGDIIEREYMSIGLETKITETCNWMAERVPVLFGNAVSRLQNDRNFFLERQSNDPQDVLRCYPRRPEDGRIFWDTGAKKILRLINASNRPFPGAFCQFEGKKLVIWDADIAPHENFLAVPGQITLIGNGFVDVATGEGKLRIFSIEFDGEIVAPNDVIHSTRKRLE